MIPQRLAYPVAEAAELLGISRRGLYNWIHDPECDVPLVPGAPKMLIPVWWINQITGPPSTLRREQGGEVVPFPGRRSASRNTAGGHGADAGRGPSRPSVVPEPAS